MELVFAAIAMLLEPSEPPVYSAAQVGLWETDVANCGNRLADSGAALHVSVYEWTVHRGGPVEGDLAIDGDRALVGDAVFYKCV